MPFESYVVGKVIGKGSYGQVSLARHKKDKKQYVIKKIDLHEASDKERSFAQQEVQILAKLKHPNIVSYKESFQNNEGFLHIVMGYCEGGDLYTKLKEQAKNNEHLSERQIVEWFVQIAMALQYMHDRNILHRDLKTQNIFLTKSKIIKIGDLGIARVLESTADMATTLIGTPYYMSPELFSNKPYNYKSDVWALGCCVYEMTTLKHAFNARDMNALVYKILKGKTPPMPKQYSEELSSIIKSMLENNPADRPSASKILRHPYIKKHIALFLKGTESRRKQGKEKSKEKSQAKPTSSSRDSGYSGSAEVNPEGIATASGIDLDIVNEERKGKYLVNDDDCEKDENSADRRQGNVSRPSAEGDPPHLIQKRDEKGVQEKKISPLPRIEARKVAVEEQVKVDLSDEKRKAKKVERVLSADDKYDVQRKRPSQKNRKQYGARIDSPSDKPIAVKNPRPLPPRPVESQSSPVFEGRERSLTDPGDAGDNTPVQMKLPKASVGVPNVSARQKRRQRMAGEAYPYPLIRRSSGQSKSVSSSSQATPRKVKTTDAELDSVDGMPRSISPTSDDDSGAESTSNREKRLSSEGPHSPVNDEQSGTDITDLIGTMKATLNMEQSSGSSRPQSSSADGHVELPVEVDLGNPALSQTVSGRLNDRIQRLRRECIRGVGEIILKRAFEVLEKDNEELEEAFISLMGREKYETFGDAIQQLKFCEEFAERSL